MQSRMQTFCLFQKDLILFLMQILRIQDNLSDHYFVGYHLQDVKACV